MVGDEGPQLFVNARMRARDKGTVKHEVGAMFQFLEWLKFKRYIARVPSRPKYRPKDLGTRMGPQRAEPVHLEDETALKIILLLPEYAGRGSFGRCDGKGKGAFVCRDWMRFAFETGLRPSTVARLRVGPHWLPGRDTLRITADIDKGRNAAEKGKSRSVPLTKVAQAILERHAPKVGIIFGKPDGRPHDIRVQWKRAAIAVLGEEEGSRCAPYDLRHGANFRMRSTVGGSLGGSMHLVGHSRATTNDRYMRGSEQAARGVVALLNERNRVLATKTVRKTVRK
jgi:integrase